VIITKVKRTRMICFMAFFLNVLKKEEKCFGAQMYLVPFEYISPAHIKNAHTCFRVSSRVERRKTVIWNLSLRSAQSRDELCGLSGIGKLNMITIALEVG